MLKKTLPVLVAIGTILFTGSCYKKGSTGPAGPSYTGAINGHVSFYDQYGNKLYSGYNNMQLTLSNCKTVSPDTTGYFIFDSVVTGAYTLTATTPGYAATMLRDIRFINDTFYQDVKMSAIPTFSLSSFTTIHSTGSGYDSLVINLTEDAKARNCIVFVGNKPSVSNAPANYLYTYVKAIAANATTVVIRVPAGDLNNAGLFYGEEVYYAAYSYVVNDASVYEDMATGNNVYNAVSSPLVDSALCP